MRRVFGAFVAVAAIALLAGCASYRLGTGAAPRFASLYVEPVSNRTLLPQAQAVLTTRLREGFIRDGRAASVNSAGAAAATLTTVITEYRRDIAAVRADDTGLARKFNVSLTVACTLREARTGQLLWDQRPFTATREVFTDSGQLQAEYQVLPLLAESLSDHIIRAAFDTW